MVRSVSVRVPATSANFGPGFDSFGCAFAIYNTVTVTPEGNGLSVTGCEERYTTKNNLAFLGYSAMMKAADLPVEAGLHIHIEADVPVSRGLGSSATLILGGAVAALKLHPQDFSSLCDKFGGEQNLLLCVTTEIEGHPDNLAPAIFGGMTASMIEDGRPHSVSCPLSEKLAFAAIIPSFRLATKEARAVLPDQIPRADAVYNLSHASVLLRGLSLGDEKLIRLALRDRIHQPYRIPLIPHYHEAEEAAIASGAFAYCISGAGSTQLAFLRAGDEALFLDRMSRRLADIAPDWQVRLLPVAPPPVGYICSVL